MTFADSAWSSGTSAFIRGSASILEKSSRSLIMPSRLSAPDLIVFKHSRWSSVSERGTQRIDKKVHSSCWRCSLCAAIRFLHPLIWRQRVETVRRCLEGYGRSMNPIP